MSILLASKVQYFTAPVTIGPTSVSVQSSWKQVAARTLKEYETDERVRIIARLCKWSQNYKDKHIICTLDWLCCVLNQDNQYFVELKCEHIHDIDITLLPEISEKVHKILNKDNFVLHLKQLIQHTQPGEGSD